MQTFLPYPNFTRSAQSLDRQRLGKQRVEAMQILRTLRRETIGWEHHPAVKMWRGYEHDLALYGWLVCEEWRMRGYIDNCQPYFNQHLIALSEHPPWLGSEPFHRSHQSNLVRKLPSHYRQFFPDVPDDLPYVWPTTQTGAVV